MGWIRDEIHRGFPMRTLEIPSRCLRGIFNVPELFRQPIDTAASVITCALNAAGRLPADAYLVGLRSPIDRDTVCLTYVHPSFPALDEGHLIPLELVELTEDNREAMRQYLEGVRDGVALVRARMT